MIRFFLLQNRQGRPRLSRWYVPCPESERMKIERELYHVVKHSRENKTCPIVEFKEFKLVIRQYAGLYFICGVDVNENELSVRELINLMVELLDAYFGDVCELDIVYNFHKAYELVEEVILGGHVSETCIEDVLQRVRAAESVCEMADNTLTTPKTRGTAVPVELTAGSVGG